MSLAKRLLELPKNSELRKRGETFLSGKKMEPKLHIAKGVHIELKDGRKGSIYKYYSKTNLQIALYHAEGLITVSIGDIAKNIETPKQISMEEAWDQIVNPK